MNFSHSTHQGWFRACGGLVLLFLLAARAAAQSIPVVVERLEPAVAENAAAQIVAGRYDDRFVAQG